MRAKRLEKFDRHSSHSIIIDEAHHCLSESYQRVLKYFDSANVLGVTATPDRGDMRNLGSFSRAWPMNTRCRRLSRVGISARSRL
ncbi:DEAD/DEAH box helicase family protein [Brevibacillus brevis]|uniref:DEAD/DEAH box helicase family protein n=1 Tax=Brevibacillus brevis TaxID=1393 RepID=UPI00363FA766